jgi:hypothetical protein
MTQHRNTVTIAIRISENPNLAILANDKSHRVMLFCATDNNSVQPIAFPHQSEFKVNGGEIKANLRGLKGKPGTTRPVDVTDSLRLRPANYHNSIEFTYALTDKVRTTIPSPEVPVSKVAMVSDDLFVMPSVSNIRWTEILPGRVSVQNGLC